MKGNNISCSLNRIKIIETTDATIKAPGQIGMWTNAGAVTYFDDLNIRSFQRTDNFENVHPLKLF